MNRSFANGHDNQTWRPATRCFICDPEQGWVRMTVSRGRQAYTGRIPLPALAGRNVKVAFAYIETSPAKVVRLTRLEYAHWEVDDEGWVSQDAIQAGIMAKMNDDGSLLPTDGVVLSPCDRNALLRCLGVTQQHF